MFGDRAHVRLRHRRADGVAVHRARRSSGRASAVAGVRPIPASLEDVFIDLVSRAAAPARGRAIQIAEEDRGRSTRIFRSMLAAGCWRCPRRPRRAQEAPLRLTLEEAIARAEQNSQRVAELQARVEVAAAVEAGREAASRPGRWRSSAATRAPITSTSTRSRCRTSRSARSIPDVPDNYRARIDLQWPIYTGGRQAALERAAGAERDAAGVRRRGGPRSTPGSRPTRAFWALVTATQTEEVVAARARQRSTPTSRDLRSRLDQGLIPPNEVLSAEAQRSRQQLLAIEARNLRQVAKADLRRPSARTAAAPSRPRSRSDPPRRRPTAGSLDAGPELSGPSGGRSPAASRRRESAKRPRRRPPGRRSRSAAATTTRGRTRASFRASTSGATPGTSRSTSAGRSGTAAAAAPKQAEAAADTRALTARGAEFDRQLAFEVEQRRLEVDSAHGGDRGGRGRRARGASRRGASSASDSPPASRPAPTCSTRRPTLLQAELDRTRAIAGGAPGAGPARSRARAAMTHRPRCRPGATGALPSKSAA